MLFVSEGVRDWVTECIHVFLSTFEPGDWIFTNSFVTVLPLEEIECHTLIFHS